jgi:hypothetical protein
LQGESLSLITVIVLSLLLSSDALYEQYAESQCLFEAAMSHLDELTKKETARAKDSSVEDTVRRISDQVTFFKHVSDPTKYVLVIHQLVADLSAAVGTGSYFRKLSAADKKPLADLMSLSSTAPTQEISGVVERVCEWLKTSKDAMRVSIAEASLAMEAHHAELTRLAEPLNTTHGMAIFVRSIVSLRG